MKTTAKDIMTGINTNDVRAYVNNVDNAIEQVQEAIIKTAQRYKNNTLASQTGFVAEEVHIGSFNIDSAFKRSSLKAVAEKNGFHGDYKVMDGINEVAKGEFKHYNTAQQSENAMRGYEGRDLVGAKEQIEDIKNIAKRKASKNSFTRPEVAKEHQEVYERATDSIKKDGVSSTPKTLKEQRKITNKATKGKVDTVDLLKDMRVDVKNSAISGAISGAKLGGGIGCGISLVSNVIDVTNGRKTKQQALKNIMTDTMVSAADSAIKNAAGSAAKTASVHIAKNISNQTAKRVLGSSAPVIVAMTAVDTLKDVGRFASGDIDGAELAKSTGKNVATSAGAWAGAELGASLGAVGGPVGVVVGGVVGGILGSIGIGLLFD